MPLERVVLPDWPELPGEECARRHAPADDGRNEPAEESWPPPSPLTAPVERPPFPLAALPQALRSFVDAVATHTQTPVDLGACMALAIISACCHGRARVAVREG